MHSAPRAVRWAFVVLAIWLAAAQTRNVLFKGLDAGPLFERFAHDAVLVLAALLCLLRAAVRSQERVAWALIGGGVLAWALGEIYYTAVLWTAEVVPVPSPADAGYLLMPPLVIAGVALLMRSRLGSVPVARWADGLVAALAVGAVGAAIVFETALGAAPENPLGIATTLAYPLADLLLIGMAVGALAGTGWRLDRTWTLLAVGVATFWFADSLYLVQIANETYEAESWFDGGWWAGLVLIAAAAWQPAAARTAEPPDGLRLIVMPLCFAATGLALLIYGCFARLNALAVILAAAALLAVMARLILTFRENARMLRRSREEALTDALTGLPNRRALTRSLEQAVAGASADSPVVLALFDLDGFKLYNDTFGHPAGDALIVRLAGNLRDRLGGRGAAFRMGGDEFCVLVEAPVAAAEALIEEAGSALSERGEGFDLGCSYGWIVLPHEAADASEALRIADHRMYRRKSDGRACAGRQSRDVLLRALAERDGGLSEHADGVACHAEAVARWLGLPENEVDSVRQAGELHDIGKVAIPDAVLLKPGPLDDVEWDFMRRHTLIGERILAAAPALAAVARLVRSSHERHDGAGYPDRLAGADIPLGSRIVAVADAFDAMTTDRPYSAARSPEAALAELRACAGAQFDPDVVEAFCAVRADGGHRSPAAALAAPA